jgi:hypothetical protein
MQRINRAKNFIFLLLVGLIFVSCWNQKDILTIKNDGIVKFESEIIIRDKDIPIEAVEDITRLFMEELMEAGWKIEKKWLSKKTPYKLLFSGTGSLKKVGNKTDFYALKRINEDTYEINFIPAETEQGKSNRSIVFKKDFLGGNAEIYNKEGKQVAEIQDVFEDKVYTIKLK